MSPHPYNESPLGGQMETEHNEDLQRLYKLISGADDVKAFLDGMTRYAAATLSRATGARVECAVTLWAAQAGCDDCRQ